MTEPGFNIIFRAVCLTWFSSRSYCHTCPAESCGVLSLWHAKHFVSELSKKLNKALCVFFPNSTTACGKVISLVCFFFSWTAPGALNKQFICFHLIASLCCLGLFFVDFCLVFMALFNCRRACFPFSFLFFNGTKVPPISGATPTELKLHKLWQGEEKFWCLSFEKREIANFCAFPMHFFYHSLAINFHLPQSCIFMPTSVFGLRLEQKQLKIENFMHLLVCHKAEQRKVSAFSIKGELPHASCILSHKVWLACHCWRFSMGFPASRKVAGLLSQSE